MQHWHEFVMNHLLLFAALLAVVVLLVINLVGDLFAAAKFLSPAETVRLINQEEPVVIDLRDAGEFGNGHLDNALNVPQGKLAERMSELERYRDKNVLLCCASGSACGGASNQLKKNGFSKVFALRGGVAAWQQDNLPLVRNKK